MEEARPLERARSGAAPLNTSLTVGTPIRRRRLCSWFQREIQVDRVDGVPLRRIGRRELLEDIEVNLPPCVSCPVAALNADSVSNAFSLDYRLAGI